MGKIVFQSSLDSVRFDSVRFDSVRFDSVRFGSEASEAL